MRYSLLQGRRRGRCRGYSALREITLYDLRCGRYGKAMRNDALYSCFRTNISAKYTEELSSLLTKPIFDTEKSEFSGAIYREDGSIVLQSLRPSMLGHWRPVDKVTISRDEFVDADSCISSAIYAGHYFGRTWGHVIVETLSTAILCDKMPNVPVVFTPFCEEKNDYQFRNSFDRAKPLLAAAGWGERQLILQQGSISFGHVIVPERACVYGLPKSQASMLPEMAIVFDRIRNALAPDVLPSKVIVARRPNMSQRHHPYEEELYELFSSAGFVVIDGSSLSISEQVRCFSSANFAIGFAGSSLHNTAFSRPGIKVVEIGDKRSHLDASDLKINPMQSQICSLLNQRVSFVDGFVTEEDEIIPLSAREIFKEVHNVLYEK